MRRFAGIATLVVLSALTAGGARAADLISYPTSTAQQVPIAPPSAKSNWDGFYAGVFGAYQRSPSGGDQYGLGVDIGVNTTFNFVLAGAEVSVTGLGAGSGVNGYVDVLGRGGLLLTDKAVLYAAAGYGIETNGAGQGDALLGGGLEYAITDAVSLRAQYLHGFPVSGSNAKDQVTLGAQFHF
jgi:outer membrane immunogenic protein